MTCQELQEMFELYALGALEPEEKTEIANPGRDECFFGSRRSGRFVKPKPNEQIRSHADEFPRNEEQQETVGDEDP